MSAPRGKVVVTPTPAPTEKALPILETFGIAPHSSGRGYVVVSLTTQGDKVLSKEVLSTDPEPMAHAAARSELELRKAYLLRGSKA